MKIVELTSAHPQFDTRIFHKICKTLVFLGHEVIHIGPCLGPGVEGLQEGVIMKPIPLHKSRFERFTKNLWRLYQAALQEKADLYHFHDPDLIPVALLLKAHGKKVLYDVHEDYVVQMLHKPWIPSFLRKFIGKITRFFEWIATYCLDGCIAATPTIAKKYPPHKTLTLCNYPQIETFKELFGPRKPYEEKWITYIGTITEERGFFSMLEATKALPQACFKLAGPLKESHKKVLACYPQADYRGNLNKNEVLALLQKSFLGLVVLHPTHSYIHSLPVKMFEYMAAGIPVIASHFPLFKEILEVNECGICVDPLDIKAIQRAIEHLCQNPERAEEMGKKGQRAIQDQFNWEAQIPALDAFIKRFEAR